MNKSRDENATPSDANHHELNKQNQDSMHTPVSDLMDFTKTKNKNSLPALSKEKKPVEILKKYDKLMVTSKDMIRNGTFDFESSRKEDNYSSNFY